ncbi:MAG: methyltransferase domain-containing protein [Oscillatoriales cyanobacterium RM2_1_1]|nr:methyltransferase domain-containing protein [Oscillatoriales cyanobacterium SM2_3_0]NJO44782.1 methyltransferase domain-containing protein [Oscillatoriales cyanobacterium RM2_1_1]
MSQASQNTCPICSSSQWQTFFEVLSVPVFCNILWPEKLAAQRCNRGDLRLNFCSNCSFIGNIAFDPDHLDYAQTYENALDFSPRFQTYAHSLATQLIEQHDLHHKTILEIGCGKGEFLLLLCELGDNRGIGFDPTYIPLEEHGWANEKIQFIQDYYSEKYIEYQNDFVCCRHTLEHIPQPTQLLNILSNNLKKTIQSQANPGIFFEVPNALDTFSRSAIWDIIYEHCCYFSPVALTYAFSSCGFKVEQVTEEFQGQFLCLEAHLGEPTTTLTKVQQQQVSQLVQDIKQFTIRFNQTLEIWQEKLRQFSQNHQKVVLWGAGSKGVTFLNFLKVESSVQSPIEYVVDINPRKQGMYVAGTGQKIVSPEFLQEYQPDIVIIMNPIYKDEIQKMLTDLGVQDCSLTIGF